MKEPYRGKIIATKSKIIYDIGLVYCYDDHNYCILIVCTLHITVVCHDGNNLAPRHFLPILNSFSPSGTPRTVPAEDRKPMLHIRADDKLSQVGIGKLIRDWKIAIRPACNSKCLPYLGNRQQDKIPMPLEDLLKSVCLMSAV